MGPLGRPNNTTVSPDRTDWTRATPCLGNTMALLAVAVAVPAASLDGLDATPAAEGSFGAVEDMMMMMMMRKGMERRSNRTKRRESVNRERDKN